MVDSDAHALAGGLKLLPLHRRVKACHTYAAVLGLPSIRDGVGGG
eukprot:COSAG01_NODE_23841_length_799_cov_177.185714_1_plen_44_part_10